VYGNCFREFPFTKREVPNAKREFPDVKKESPDGRCGDKKSLVK
jgi:hypothetical protein